MVMYDDPRILRAIAHPTRNRVLGELSAAGSLRAADIARRIDIPANQASFHLRQLAKYGLVEEDPDAANDRRDRVWRLVDPDGIQFKSSTMLAQPGGRAAYAVFQRNAVEWGRHLVERAYELDDVDHPGRSTSLWSLQLTADEAIELMEEVSEVINRRRLAGQQAPAEEGRQTYSVFQIIQPYPDLPPPADPDNPDNHDEDA